MIPTLRILTRKSKIKFGRYKDYTVQKMLDKDNHRELINYYYTYTNINYIEDILEELKITPKFRIKKPGKGGFEHHKQVLKLNNLKPKEKKLFVKNFGSGTKGSLQRKNQGK